MVLRTLGMLEEVVARSEPIDELHALTHRGRTLIKLPYAEYRRACAPTASTAATCSRCCIAPSIARAVVAVHLGCEMRSYREAAR